MGKLLAEKVKKDTPFSTEKGHAFQHSLKKDTPFSTEKGQAFQHAFQH
jgi:hypothetical protein